MTTSEFDEIAALTAERLAGCPIDERIAAACRGSGNPAALAWLAEESGIGPGAPVIDLGSGLAGPSAWLARHYGWLVVALDPSPGATRGARQLFEVPVVRADAACSPLRADAFALALVFGVVSVVDEPVRVLAEAARLAGTVSVIEHCGTGGATIAAGGSRFPTPEGLLDVLGRSGFERCVCIEVTTPAPPRWQEGQKSFDADDKDRDAHRSARLIDELISAGELSPYAVVAHRA